MKPISKDIEKIANMTVLQLYRRSLQLIKTYPSLNKEEMRKAIILEYREKKELKDPEEIQKAITSARSGLANLIMYNLKRLEILDDSKEISQNIKEKTTEKIEIMNPKGKKEDYIYF